MGLHEAKDIESRFARYVDAFEVFENHIMKEIPVGT